MNKDKPTWLPFVDKVNTYNQNSGLTGWRCAQRERVCLAGEVSAPTPNHSKTKTVTLAVTGCLVEAWVIQSSQPAQTLFTSSFLLTQACSFWAWLASHSNICCVFSVPTVTGAGPCLLTMFLPYLFKLYIPTKTSVKFFFCSYSFGYYSTYCISPELLLFN